MLLDHTHGCAQDEGERRPPLTQNNKTPGEQKKENIKKGFQKLSLV